MRHRPTICSREFCLWPNIPNLFMKVPGLGEICPRPARFPRPSDPLENIPPVIEMAMDAFGASRLMWGSDYPHVAEREGYGNCIRLLREQVVKNKEDREMDIRQKPLQRCFGLANSKSEVPHSRPRENYSDSAERGSY